jgi:hypothetical protein
MCLEQDWKDDLHPTRYAAGVLFEDGTVKACHQQKALEYGSSLDPVTQLAPSLDQKAGAGVKPLLIMQMDQYGESEVCSQRL